MNDPLDEALKFARNIGRREAPTNISGKSMCLVEWIVHDDLGTRLKASGPPSSALASRFKAKAGVMTPLGHKAGGYSTVLSGASNI